MTAKSIRSRGVEKHINDYAKEHDIEYRYKDLIEWLYNGVLGERVSKEWARRRFGLPAQTTFDKWVNIIQEEHGKIL